MTTTDREFMQDIPVSVMATDGAGKEQYVGDDDTIFCITVENCLHYLQNDREFYENPTKAQMKKSLTKFMRDCVDTLEQDFGWYVDEAFPKFLEKDLKHFKYGILIGESDDRFLFGSNARDLFDTAKDALKHIGDVLKNNTPERLASIRFVNPVVVKVETWGPNRDVKMIVAKDLKREI